LRTRGIRKYGGKPLLYSGMERLKRAWIALRHCLTVAETVKRIGCGSNEEKAKKKG
jgi:hypothetical protein